MKTIVTRFAQMITGMPILLFCLIGCTTPPPQEVRLSLMSATIQQHNESTYLVICEAVLDNRIGESLSVTSNFNSAFDDLRLMVYDEKENLLMERHYCYHQSPSTFYGRQFKLKTGRNTHELRFPLPVTVFPVSASTITNLPSIKVRLVGHLPGSTYPFLVKSSLVPVTTISRL